MKTWMLVNDLLVDVKLSSSPVSSLGVVSIHSALITIPKFSIYLMVLLVLYLTQLGKGLFCLFFLASFFLMIKDLNEP